MNFIIEIEEYILFSFRKYMIRSTNILIYLLVFIIYYLTFEWNKYNVVTKRKINRIRFLNKAKKNFNKWLPNLSKYVGLYNDFK